MSEENELLRHAITGSVLLRKEERNQFMMTANSYEFFKLYVPIRGKALVIELVSDWILVLVLDAVDAYRLVLIPCFFSSSHVLVRFSIVSVSNGI